jgi:RNA polymerase sigma-70 factor (ECF subfamily)
LTQSKAISQADWMDFEKRLRAYVRGRVDPQWADDIVGDILLDLVRHRDTLQQAANPLAYMQRVATNALTDHYRRRAAERRALESVEREDVDRADLETEKADNAGGDIAKCLLPFIVELPDRYRDALMATEIDGLSQAAAARRFGLSVSGMKSRVQRGRRKLKHALLRCCAIEFDRRGGVMDTARRSVCCD